MVITLAYSHQITTYPKILRRFCFFISVKTFSAMDEKASTSSTTQLAETKTRKGACPGRRKWIIPIIVLILILVGIAIVAVFTTAIKRKSHYDTLLERARAILKRYPLVDG